MNSNLQNKLQQFQADPPEGTWNKIADGLANEEAFPQRLYQYEEQPPAGAWQGIEAKLTNEPASVVPFTTRFRKPLRYAAVACLIAALLTTITLTFKRTEAGAIAPGSNTTVPTTTTATAQQNNPSNRNAIVFPASAQQDNSTDNPASTDVRNSTASSERKKAQPRVVEATTLSSMNDYVLFRDGDGQLRKVSKKMAAFLNCTDGDCQQRLKALRQKMATKATTTDFTGILEMLHQLQQKP